VSCDAVKARSLGAVDNLHGNMLTSSLILAGVRDGDIDTLIDGVQRLLKEGADVNSPFEVSSRRGFLPLSYVHVRKIPWVRMWFRFWL
jgi:hypothetical protein